MRFLVMRYRPLGAHSTLSACGAPEGARRDAARLADTIGLRFAARRPSSIEGKTSIARMLQRIAARTAHAHDRKLPPENRSHDARRLA
jgi:hypothetical protein